MRGVSHLSAFQSIPVFIYVLILSQSLSAPTYTHTHTQQTHTEYISPRVDNVTFPVFHYLVLTVREHLAHFPPSLCIYFGISGMFWERLLFCVIAMALHCEASLHIWRAKTSHLRMSALWFENCTECEDERMWEWLIAEATSQTEVLPFLQMELGNYLVDNHCLFIYL